MVSESVGLTLGIECLLPCLTSCLLLLDGLLLRLLCLRLLFAGAFLASPVVRPLRRTLLFTNRTRLSVAGFFPSLLSLALRRESLLLRTLSLLVALPEARVASRCGALLGRDSKRRRLQLVLLLDQLRIEHSPAPELTVEQPALLGQPKFVADRQHPPIDGPADYGHPGHLLGQLAGGDAEPVEHLPAVIARLIAELGEQIELILFALAHGFVVAAGFEQF